MAGHSKWANIKHKKAKEDAKRGKIFTRLIREITVAARMGGDDPDSNPRLRAAIQTALAANMTRDTIERAAKKGAGNLDGGEMFEIRYEGYAPCGVAVIVDCMSDNKNRTVSEVRHAFSKCGGNLGTDGSVSYMFTREGIIILPASEDYSEEEVMEWVIDSDIDPIDLNTLDDGLIELKISPNDFSSVLEMITAKKIQPEIAEVTESASNSIEINNLEDAQKVMKLLDMLEDLDDTQNVFSNVDISPEIAEQL